MRHSQSRWNLCFLDVQLRTRKRSECPSPILVRPTHSGAQQVSSKYTSFPSWSGAVLAGATGGVFFSPFTRPAVNPGVGTGLPSSILRWQQDCPHQSWRGQDCPRCLPENIGSAVLYSTALPDSPPGLPENSVSALLCSRALTENSVSASLHSDTLPDSPPASRL